MTTPTTKIATASTQTYAAAYAVLAGIAEKLRAAGSAATVDSLVDDLRQARAAYAVCRSRLDAIRAEVDAEMALAPDSAPKT